LRVSEYFPGGGLKCWLQECATQGPRAKSGPGAEALWPTESSRF